MGIALESHIAWLSHQSVAPEVARACSMAADAAAAVHAERLARMIEDRVADGTHSSAAIADYMRAEMERTRGEHALPASMQQVAERMGRRVSVDLQVDPERLHAEGLRKDVRPVGGEESMLSMGGRDIYLGSRQDVALLSNSIDMHMLVAADTAADRTEHTVRAWLLSDRGGRATAPGQWASQVREMARDRVFLTATDVQSLARKAPAGPAPASLPPVAVADDGEHRRKPAVSRYRPSGF